MFNCFIHGWSHIAQICPECFPTWQQTSTSAGILEAQTLTLENELERVKKIAADLETRLSKYECHHGYRKDQSCISAYCDSANHRLVKL